MESLGQKKEVWSQEWGRLSPESEIRMWDYFGLRQWILKYVPRHGKVLEAGCGLGRYNFYLSHFGIDTIGLDFSERTIEFLKSWQKKHNYNLNFVSGDVTKLDFESGSLSGYLSLGVVEHFIEGPQNPLKEAYRVLRPGGIAIISTPAPSWSKIYFKNSGRVKQFVKKIIGRKIPEKSFFQYEYSHGVLKNFVEGAGFFVSRHTGADWLYTFTEFGRNTDKYIKENSFGYRVSHLLEDSFLSWLGAQSIVIGIKSSELMHCFFCNKKIAAMDSLYKFDVPVCLDCYGNANIKYYKKSHKTSFHTKYSINPPILKEEQRKCEFCSQLYQTDVLFENFGFNKDICPICLKESGINIFLSNSGIQPIWRNRNSL